MSQDQQRDNIDNSDAAEAESCADACRPMPRPEEEVLTTAAEAPSCAPTGPPPPPLGSLVRFRATNGKWRVPKGGPPPLGAVRLLTRAQDSHHNACDRWRRLLTHGHASRRPPALAVTLQVLWHRHRSRAADFRWASARSPGVFAPDSSVDEAAARAAYPLRRAGGQRSAAGTEDAARGRDAAVGEAAASGPLGACGAGGCRPRGWRALRGGPPRQRQALRPRARRRRRARARASWDRGGG